MKFDKIEQIEQLAKIFEKSSMLEFSYSSDGVEIYMSRKGEAGQAGTAAMPVVTPAPIALPEEDQDNYITSPMVGVFYVASTPDAKPFVAVGDTLKAEQTVCIVEAMKMMYEIKSQYECRIETVMVSNGAKVEYGQPLFKVKKL